MSLIVEFTRASWTNGISSVNSRPKIGLGKWLETSSDYMVNDASGSQFRLTISNHESFLKSIAYDFNRFSQSSLETLENTIFSAKLPKSKCWSLIKVYYSGFFAAHSILRIFGKGVIQLDENTLVRVRELSSLTFPGHPRIERGFYSYEIDNNTNTIEFKKLTKPDGGSHEKFWKFFNSFIVNLSNCILSSSNSPESNSVFNKLDELSRNFTYVGNQNGTWLSQVRNDVNYRHLYGVWFPYSGYPPYIDDITKLLQQTRKDPMEIELKNYIGKEILRFASTCIFLTSFSHQLNIELRKRCPTGKSFVDYGALSFVNHLDGL